MTVRDLALAGLEQAINRLFKLDPQATSRLKKLHGKVIAIILQGSGISLYFIPDQQGLLQVLGRYEGESDCSMIGSPLDLLRASHEDAAASQLFAGNVRIEGDTELAHRFSNILSGLDIDWEEQLSRISGDIFAYQAGRTVRNAADYAQQTSRRLQANLSEYLTEEARFLPSRYEVEEFLDDVDSLRDDLERLSARIERLAVKLAPDKVEK